MNPRMSKVNIIGRTPIISHYYNHIFNPMFPWMDEINVVFLVLDHKGTISQKKQASLPIATSQRSAFIF